MAHIYKPYIYCSLNSAELCDVGHANFRGKFRFTKSPKMKNFAKLLLGHLTDLHQTLQVASLDKTFKTVP